MVKERDTPKTKTWFRCPECGSTNYYFRALLHNWRCRRCGCLFIGDPNNNKTIKVE